MIGWTIDVGNVKARPYRDTAGCGAAGYRRLLEHLDGRGDPKTVRDRAIVRLLFERALRRNEVASLDVEHLDLDAGTISVLGKGHTDRETSDAARADAPGAGRLAGDPRHANRDRSSPTSTAPGREPADLTGAGIWAIVTALGEATGQTRPPSRPAPCGHHHGPRRHGWRRASRPALQPPRQGRYRPGLRRRPPRPRRRRGQAGRGRVVALPIGPRGCGRNGIAAVTPVAGLVVPTPQATYLAACPSQSGNRA